MASIILKLADKQNITN